MPFISRTGNGQLKKTEGVKVQSNAAEAVKIIKYFTVMLRSERKKTSFLLFSVQLDEKNFTKQGQRTVCYFCSLVFFWEQQIPTPSRAFRITLPEQ